MSDAHFFPCGTCKRDHLMAYQKCPACQVYETLQPVSETVAEACRAPGAYQCDGCDAYEDHLA